jgi:hypothetical protein
MHSDVRKGEGSVPQNRRSAATIDARCRGSTCPDLQIPFLKADGSGGAKLVLRRAVFMLPAHDATTETTPREIIPEWTQPE